VRVRSPKKSQRLLNLETGYNILGSNDNSDSALESRVIYVPKYDTYAGSLVHLDVIRW